MFVTDVLDMWVRTGKNVYKPFENIAHAKEWCEANETTGISHLYYFRKVFELAKEKFVLWKKRNRTYKIEEFIKRCKQYRPGQSEGLSLEYYADNGGYLKSSHFLFGIASQFR